MTETFRMPKDFPALVYLSMALQAEGIRYGVEHWRRNKQRVAGTIYWQLNDCWPVASWASLDYFGRWKALHYTARRFYAPLLLSIEDGPASQALYLTSDLGEAWEGEIRWSLETLDGEALLTGVEPARVEAYASAAVRRLDFSEPVSGGVPAGAMRRELVFVAELHQGGQRLALQTAGFIPTKHLALADPRISAGLALHDGGLQVTLAAQSLARLVEVALEGVDVVFSDNYFDLPARRKVTVSCPLPAGWTLEQARNALRVRSVYDSYAH
jgi:beta-mannosidase